MDASQVRFILTQRPDVALVIDFTLPDDTPVSIDAHGRVLQGDPAKIEKHPASTIRNDKGLDRVATLDGFQEWQESRASGGAIAK